jgi:hypothetical protein
MLKRVVVLACLVATLSACRPAGLAERADLAFWFTCESRASPALETKIIEYLHQQDFEALNVGAIQREHGINVLTLKITALDSKNRIIEIIGFRHPPTKKAVALYSQPPTRHDSALEESLLSFTSTGIGCNTSQVTRGDNPAGAREFHDSYVRRIQGLFREAKELRANGA